MAEPDKYEISPLKLWSPLRRQLAACDQAKGSPQQWIGTMRKLQRKGVSTQEAMAYGRALVERMARRLAAEGFVGQTRSLNQFTRFVLPGGEHYTEWLITAPKLRPMAEAPRNRVGLLSTPL